MAWLVATALVYTVAMHAVVAAEVVVSEGSITLSNGRCALSLNRETGEIESLQPGPPSLRGNWLEVVEEEREELQPWETWERGAETVFAGGPAEVSTREDGGTARARVLWRRPNGLRIVGEVELGPKDPGPRLRVTVRNTTGRALVDTLRIRLQGVALGDAEDDWFTWPHTLGARFRVRGFAPGQKLQHAYPDFMYMQWLDLYDESQGVYLGCLDDYGYCKELFIGRDEAGESQIGIEFVGCWVAERGDEWTTPWVQIAAHEGGWRAGADLYRPFAQTAFGPLDPPQRVWEMPTAQCWLAHHANDGDVGKLFEIQQQTPIHASYLMKSLNTSTPEGWDGFRGSALELQQAFGRIEELGGSSALFTFDRAPLMGRPDYADHVRDWTLQHRDRSIAEGFRDMMPAPFDADYVRARVGEAERWAQTLGVDEMHLDTAATTGSGLAGPCYGRGQTQRPNEVPHYFKALYRAIRDACRRHNPAFILRAEHCADFFYPEFLTSTAHFFETGNLVAAHNPPADAQLMPILFKYTLPQHAALQMPSMSDSDFWTYGYGMGYGFHGGGPSWCFNPGVREAESPPGEPLHRYRYYLGEWLRYYDFRVGLAEAVIEGERADVVAKALIDGEWRRCDFPGPVIAVTHYGKHAEATLGQWYDSQTRYFGERFVTERLEPRPIRLRVPTRLERPWVRLHGDHRAIPTEAKVQDGVVEVEIEDPRVFALEVAEGPDVSLTCPPVLRPGETVAAEAGVEQGTPSAGQLEVILPAGWEPIPPIHVPAERSFRRSVTLSVPDGLFGRCYPLKTVFRSGDLKRTSAGHVLVMEPLTVLYDFDALGPDGPRGLHCVDPGQPARLTVTCVNNTLAAATVEVTVEGEQVSGHASEQLAGQTVEGLLDPDNPLYQWTDGKTAEPPESALVTHFDFDCSGVPRKPVRVRVALDGEVLFEDQAWPRTRLMDLNGEWRASSMRRSEAQVGGVEGNDNLDLEATTPQVWDGGWERLTTPIRLDEEARRTKSWGVYRRLVYLPDEWQGANVWLRLSHMGAPWGAGGTLNLVTINGYPVGRVGTSGEVPLSSFLVFGGWNLVAVCSMAPNSLVDPYLFVRDAPAPERLLPCFARAQPEGAFLLLGQRPTGQGISLVFIQGVPEGECRRTDIARGGEHQFIYFAVADDFLFDAEGPVEIAIEYLDEGTGPFGIAYDSDDPNAPINGAFKDAPPVRRTNSGEWRTHVFVLPDARLTNREHLGADFRLWAQEADLRVRRVEVRQGTG